MLIQLYNCLQASVGVLTSIQGTQNVLFSTFSQWDLHINSCFLIVAMPTVTLKVVITTVKILQNTSISLCVGLSKSVNQYSAHGWSED